MADSNTSLLDRALQQHRSGNLIEAAKNYRKFLKKNPSNPGGLYLLGCLEYQRGKNETATDLLLEAVAIEPYESDYHNALGLALTGIGKYEDAELSFHRALQIENRATFHANLALLLRKQPKRLPEAIANFRRALELKPDDTEILCEIGDLFQEIGQFKGACDVYEKALAIDPELVRAWYSRGCAENARQEYIPAAHCFRKAVDLQPDWLQARHNLARALYEIGHVSEACGHFARCDAAESRAMLAVIIPGDAGAGNEAVLAARRKWATMDLPSARQPPMARRAEKERIRIGYVSSFFQRDNWMKPVWGLIHQHNREAFHVNLFSDCAASEIKHGYRPYLADRFFNTTGLSNEGLAALIREAEIDILIDLNGFSNMRRLPFYTLRPAPILIGWFNMYATSGMSCFNYLIGDEHVIPASEESFYSEKILRVPGSYLTFNVDYPVPEVSDSPLATNGGITFGSLASQYKLTPEVLFTWSRILQATPNSTLLLKNKHLASLTTQQYLRSVFQEYGIASERLTLEGPADHFEFLKAYERIDIALDPFPYNGGTTTTEALWQGVPVVAFHGDRWASRTSASILHAAGLSDLVAKDQEDYTSVATQWAKNTERLLILRRAMRAQLAASSVCDARGFARHMEKLYLAVMPYPSESPRPY
jgi:predicted O-linked N-acetylglucosamine transferase (SPINDLY family)